MQSTNETCARDHDQPNQGATRTTGFQCATTTAMEVESAEALGIGEPGGGVAEAASAAEEPSPAMLTVRATKMFIEGDGVPRAP